MTFLSFATLLLCLSNCIKGDPGGTGGTNGGGSATHGSVGLNVQSQSGFTNALPWSNSQSMNTGQGSGISISGESDSYVKVDPLQDINVPSQVYMGFSSGGSNGNAATGTLNNHDQTNINSGNTVLYSGSSQINGNGTQISLNNNANSGVSRSPITTTTPWTTSIVYCTSTPYCGPPCVMNEVCYCACPPVSAVPLTGSALSKILLNNHATAVRQRQEVVKVQRRVSGRWRADPVKSVSKDVALKNSRMRS